jgi:hypothetical protein
MRRPRWRSAAALRKPFPLPCGTHGAAAQGFGALKRENRGAMPLWLTHPAHPESRMDPGATPKRGQWITVSRLDWHKALAVYHSHRGSSAAGPPFSRRWRALPTGDSSGRYDTGRERDVLRGDVTRPHGPDESERPPGRAATNGQSPFCEFTIASGNAFENVALASGDTMRKLVDSHPTKGAMERVQ